MAEAERQRYLLEPPMPQAHLRLLGYPCKRRDATTRVLTNTQVDAETTSSKARDGCCWDKMDTLHFPPYVCNAHAYLAIIHAHAKTTLPDGLIT